MSLYSCLGFSVIGFSANRIFDSSHFSIFYAYIHFQFRCISDTIWILCFFFILSITSELRDILESFNDDAKSKENERQTMQKIRDFIQTHSIAKQWVEKKCQRINSLKKKWILILQLLHVRHQDLWISIWKWLGQLLRPSSHGVWSRFVLFYFYVPNGIGN